MFHTALQPHAREFLRAFVKTLTIVDAADVVGSGLGGLVVGAGVVLRASTAAAGLGEPHFDKHHNHHEGSAP